MSALSDVDNLRLHDIADGDVRDDPQWRELVGYDEVKAFLTEMAAKHLPGQHNQESHGHGHGVDVIPGDKLKLASRIDLKPGEKLLSSQRIRSGQWDVLTAEIDTPSGRQVRLGVIDPGDRGKWTAGPDPKRSARVRQLDEQMAAMVDERGDDATDADEYERLREERDELSSDSDGFNRTASLTSAQAGRLRSDIEAGIAKARAMIARDERPDSGEFATGMISGGLDGDVDWRLDDAGTGEDDDWVLWLAIRPHGEGDDWLPEGDDTAQFDPENTKALLKALAELSGDHPKSSRLARLKHPGHSPQSVHGNHHGGIDLIPPLAGLSVLDDGEYSKLYGDVLDERLVSSVDDIDLSVRAFHNGDAHIVLDLPGGRHQVMSDFDGPDSMRALSTDIRTVQHAKVPDGEPFEVGSTQHDYLVAKDNVGDVRLRQSDQAEDDYLELSEEEAWDLFDALEQMADAHDNEFGEEDDEDEEDDDEDLGDTAEIVGGKSGRRKHLPGRHDQSKRYDPHQLRDYLGRWANGADADAPDFPLNQPDKRTASDIRNWYGGLNAGSWKKLSPGAQKAAVALADSESIDNGNHHPAEVINALQLGIPHVGLRLATHMPPDVMFERSTKDINDWYGKLTERDYRGLGDKWATVTAVARRQSAKGNPLPQQKLEALREQVKANPGNGLVGRTSAVDVALAQVTPSGQIGVPAEDVGPREFNWLQPARAEQLQGQLTRDTPWTPEQRTALSSYTNNTYRQINGGLRNPEKPGDEHDKVRYLERAGDIQSAMRPWPEHTIVHRGTSPDQFGLDIDPEDYDQLQTLVGREFVDDGFTSTSVERSESFDYPVKLEIRVPQGTPAAYVAKVSQVSTEHELVLAAGTRFRVLSADVIDLDDGEEGEYDERPYSRYVEMVMQVVP